MKDDETGAIRVQIFVNDKMTTAFIPVPDSATRKPRHISKSEWEEVKKHRAGYYDLPF